MFVCLCLFVCLFVRLCLFDFYFRNSLFCRKKWLYVSSKITKRLYSYMSLFFLNHWIQKSAKYLVPRWSIYFLNVRLLSLYKKRKFLSFYLVKGYIVISRDSSGLPLLSASGFWWCLRPRTRRFDSAVLPAKCRQRCEFQFLGKCEFRLISSVTTDR